jgi:hypothetical protein
MMERSGRYARRGLILLLLVATLAGCVTAQRDATALGPVSTGSTQLYMLRPKQGLYSLEAASVILDGEPIARLTDGTFAVKTVPSGRRSLTVQAFASFVTTEVDLAPGTTQYLVLTMNQSGLPQPLGTTLAPMQAQDSLGLFSIAFADETTAKSLLGGLSPAH